MPLNGLQARGRRMDDGMPPAEQQSFDQYEHHPMNQTVSPLASSPSSTTWAALPPGAAAVPARRAVTRNSSCGLPTSAWDSLKHPLYGCEGKAYQAMLSRMPPINLHSLLPPPRARVLFFGHSYLFQLFRGVVAASEACGQLMDVSDIDLCRDFGIQSACFWRDRPSTKNPVRVYYLRNGATLMQITNWGALQRRNNTVYLRDFLHKFTFDYIFYMVPHPDCFFDWMLDKTQPRCVILNGPRIHNQTGTLEQWREINRSAGPQAQVWQVLGWLQDAEADQLAHKHHTVATLSFTEKYPCRAPLCASDPHNHQCLPGPLTLLSRQLMQRISADQRFRAGEHHP